MALSGWNFCAAIVARNKVGSMVSVFAWTFSPQECLGKGAPHTQMYVLKRQDIWSVGLLAGRLLGGLVHAPNDQQQPGFPVVVARRLEDAPWLLFFFFRLNLATLLIAGIGTAQADRPLNDANGRFRDNGNVGTQPQFGGRGVLGVRRHSSSTVDARKGVNGVLERHWIVNAVLQLQLLLLLLLLLLCLSYSTSNSD